jgi:proline iminopeptidase
MKNPILIVSLVFLLCFASGFRKNEPTGIINVEGAKLHYVIEGDGVPCVVLGHPILYPRTFSSELRQSIKFIFLSLRHDAQSDNSMEISKITLETYMNDINQARRNLGLDRIAVLGHSAHGMMALEYARRFPQNTSYVIMIGTPPAMSERFQEATGEYWEKQASAERKEILKRNWERLTKDMLDKMTPSRRFINSYLANAPRVFYDPNYDATWVFEGHEYNMDMTNRVFSDAMLATYDVTKLPGQVKTPVFLALGRHDYLVPHVSWDDAMGALPNLSYNLFEKSGHFPMLEEQDLFDKKFIEWIKTLKRGAE